MSTVAMSYDKQFDILYARYTDSGYSYGEEDTEGFIIYHDVETDDITGIAIYEAGEKIKKGLLDLTDLPIPLNTFNKKIESMIFA